MPPRASTLALLVALTCPSCKGTAAETGATPSSSGAASASRPGALLDPWQPIDPAFKGCEGG